MYSTMLNLCSPALFFLLIVSIDIAYITTSISRPFDKKIKIFSFLCLCAIGWSFIINSACGYQQNIAWGIAAIPLLYLSFRLYK